MERKQPQGQDEGEIGAGALFSSGLIAGGAMTGILIAILLGINVGEGSLMSLINTEIGEKMGIAGDILGLAAFLALAILLYRVAVPKSK